MKLQRLKELALGATQGGWRNCGHDRGGCSCGQVWSLDIDFPVADCRIDDEEIGKAPLSAVIANAAYIAAACPANILPFLESYEELLAALKRIEEYGHGIGHGSGYTCANIAEQAITNAEKLNHE